MKSIHTVSTTRVTTQQQAIFQALKKSKQHITAEQMYQQVRKTLPRISLATIYRNLETLVERNMAAKVTISGAAHFEINTRPHYHVICLGCGRIEDLESIPASDIEEFFSRFTNFKLTGHQLLLSGLCPVCQRRHS